MTCFDHLIKGLKTMPLCRLAVASAEQEDVLSAVLEAFDQALTEPVLVGEKDAILAGLRRLGRTFDGRIVDAKGEAESAAAAVALVRNGEADALMKGMVSTGTLLKAVLSRDTGIRGGGLLSHVALVSVPALGRPLFISDAAINIAPDLETKKSILENAVFAAKALGYERPVAALLSAVEKVNPAMPSTVDANVLRALYEGRGDLLVDGPFALDNALFPELAKRKGITGEAAGRADILICPAIEAANVLYKALTLLAGADSAGIVLGARAPIVLTSRADSAETRLNSIAFALAVAARVPLKKGGLA